MKKIAVLLILAMTVVFAGCGSNESGTADKKEEKTEGASKGDAKEDSAGDVLADGVLTVGTNAEFPPFEYLGDDGKADGFDIALINAIGEKLGVDVQVENMEFDSLVASIGNKIDVAIAGMTVTDERKNAVDFSDSYYQAVQYVIVPLDSDIKEASDLNGKNIGVQLGTTGDFMVEDFEGATAAQYNKAVDAVNDLINGRVDAVIVDKNPALVFESKFSDKVKALDFSFEPEDYAIAIPKGDEKLLNAVNDALAELKSDGTFDKLVSEYIEN